MNEKGDREGVDTKQRIQYSEITSKQKTAKNKMAIITANYNKTEKLQNIQFHNREKRAAN